MKRTLLTLVVALAAVLPTKAFDYESARQQAWFLTDKMAYELNLTAEQYDRAYQINLDYFLSVNNPSDAFGYYWQYRNEDLRYVLFDWQYRLYAAVDYFMRPVRWTGYRWYYPIFDRYRVGYYYFGRPAIYVSYRGGFGHRPHYGGHSPYRDMRFHSGPGMRDTHRPRGGWGDRRHDGGRYDGGRNHNGGHNGGRHNDRPGSRNGGGYNIGGSHTGSAGHNGGGFRNGSGNNNRPSGNATHSGSNNRPSGGFSGGHSSNHSNPPAATSPSSNSRNNTSGSGSFGRSSGSRSGSVGSSRGSSSGSHSSGNVGSRGSHSGGHSSSGSGTSGRRFGR